MSRTAFGFEVSTPAQALDPLQADAFDKINRAVVDDPNPIVLDISLNHTTLHTLRPETGLFVEHRPKDDFTKVTLPEIAVWRAFHGRGKDESDAARINPVTSFMNLSRGLNNRLYPSTHFRQEVLVSPDDVEAHFSTANQPGVTPYQGLVVGSAAVASFAEHSLVHETQTSTVGNITSRSFALWTLMKRTDTAATLSPIDATHIADWRDVIMDRTAIDLSQIVTPVRDGVVFKPAGETAWLTTGTIDLFAVQPAEQAAILLRAQSLATARFAKRKRALIGAAAKVEYGFSLPLRHVAGATKGKVTHLATNLENVIKNLDGAPEHDNSVTFNYAKLVPVIGDLPALQADKEKLAQSWRYVATSINRTAEAHRYSSFDYGQLRRVADYALALAVVDFGMPEEFAQPEPSR